MRKTIKRTSQVSARVQLTAEIVGCSTRHVQHVLSGDRVNDEIMKVYLEVGEGGSKLLNAIKLAVPLDGRKELVVQYVDVDEPVDE
jgi:hypothetical protein